MRTFTKLFNSILTADKETSRKAAREVREAVYGSNDRGGYEIIKSIINDAPAEYEKIMEDWRRENFVMAISVMYFLHDKENKPDFLFPWLLRLLQHERGNIRHAAVRMIGNELGPLTVHLRVPNWKSTHPGYSTEKADHILFELYVNLNKMMSDLWKPSYKRYRYISSLPASPYKSVQKLLAELEEDCGKKYIADLIKRIDDINSLDNTLISVVNTESKQQILERRKEIEKEISEMLKTTGSDFKPQDVKDAIFNEEEQDDFMHVVTMFDRGGNASELGNILELVTDAWNYFPHKILGGISPAEQALKYGKK